VLAEILQFGILGLGAGAVYGLCALGIVLVYRGSGVVNFAAGAVGMLGAFIFYELRAAGTPSLLAWVLAVGYGAAIGAALHLVVMRPLRNAPPLARLIATLGVFTILFSWADQEWGQNARVVPSILPTEGVEILPGIAVGQDRLILLGIGIALTIALTQLYRRTRFGLATEAVVESRRVAAAQGIAPDAIATVNWMLGSVLSVVGAILIVNVSGLSVLGLTMLVIPALAAALLGGFRSFSLTLLGGLTIGVLESEVGWLQSYLSERAGHAVTLDGWAQTIPFLVILGVLIVRGRSLPLRGELTLKPPEVGEGRMPFAAWPALAAAVVLVSVVLSPSLVEAVQNTTALGLILLSLVVVTGLTGQLSLAQFALAGFGAWIAAILVAKAGLPFVVAAILGVAATIPVGLAVGLPSLRLRGVNLAVATLGLALVIEAQIFAVGSRTGGLLGFDIHGAQLFGLDIDATEHPRRYAVLGLLALALAAAAVATLRRGRVGRRMLAVRSNERAAASLGISVFGAKLYAFALASALAAVGGILFLFQQPSAVFFPTFSALQSVFVIVFAVIGGIGFVAGALVGALVSPNGFATAGLAELVPALESSATVQIALGAGLLVLLWLRPDGLASIRFRPPGWRRRPQPEALPVVEVERAPPATLAVRSLTVRYGGVVALDDVDLTVRPGQVVGLIGPNGAGKTTLIDAVSGFVAADGEVGLNGVEIGGWLAHRRARAGIARSFQTLELFDTMTLRENLQTASDRRDRLGYLTAPFRAGRASLALAAVAAVRDLGLEADLDRRPDELPQGRRRLAALARALATRPSVLLLDEPAAGLDDGETAELGALLRRLATRWGVGILLVEHDVSLVRRVCDSVVVLQEGRHLRSGAVDEVMGDPVVAQAYLGHAREESEPTAEGVGARPGVERETKLLEARGLSAGYGDLLALRELELAVHPGEIVAMLGPNGAGKTTAVLTLAGELPALGGSAEVLGLPAGAPLHRRVGAGLGLVPEQRGIIYGLTGAENLRLGRSSASAALQIFPELEPLIGNPAGRLSGGEQQMLALALALARKPKLLLIDELSLGLAPMVTERLLSAVRGAADEGVGILLVEQHAAAALSIADRGVVLRRGRVELEGEASELQRSLAKIEAAYLSGLGDADEPAETDGVVTSST
jgi:sulfate-transporting ATPase